MVLEDGRAKGMELVLQERGVNTHVMNAEKMRKKLNTYYLNTKDYFWTIL